MTRQDLVNEACNDARACFNTPPFDAKDSSIAFTYGRLCEINIMLHKGDELSVAFMKRRKKSLEDRLVQWHKEYKQNLNNEHKD